MRIGSSFNKQAARATGRCESGGGYGVGWRTSRTVPSSVVCNLPWPASSWISEKEGRWCKGKHDKTRLVGMWPAKSDVSHGDVARRLSLLFPSPNQRKNSARWTPRIVTRQQRRGHPSRPLWRTGRQGRVKVLPEEFLQTPRGRGRTGWVPSGRTSRQEQGP